ncbi:MAG: Aminopeptidase [uncultured Rubrobacteraceae bacterium]|uniref:Aminopeptidase n=1 Tax=uncultured Rubrobacteraceae bacterium TaxID=349277 RepID=A0A6J4RF91_9ACTN|nr:MAG: Aminopeptidase [uncultured Rubrobacteraceae bacterium]
MIDERVGKLARLLVDYSIEAGEGDQVLVSGEVGAGPLIRALYARLLQLGATPVPQVGLPGMQELFFEHAGELHYEEIPGATRAIYEAVDAQIGILAPSNTRALANVAPSKQQALQKRNKPLSEMMLEKDRWVLTLFPTEALAQEAHMNHSEYEEFVFEAMGLNESDPVRYWNDKSAEQERLIGRLEESREIRIVGLETDLTLSVEGRTFVNSAGRRNMPCGEVFTGPIEDSANGTVYFGVPAAIAGREISGARLRFEKGKVVEVSAEKGEEYLLSLLEADAGARYLGEIGIGTNYGIRRPSANILFDEKLGGTVHLAIGRSYAETGGKNDSSVHTDLVCDLREGGELYADGELIQENGRFLEFDLAGVNDAR